MSGMGEWLPVRLMLIDVHHKTTEIQSIFSPKIKTTWLAITCNEICTVQQVNLNVKKVHTNKLHSLK